MDALDQTSDPGLDNEDFYTWTQRQAALIRDGQTHQADLANIADEIETLGRSEESSLESGYRLICMHLLKLMYQPDMATKSWRLTIGRERLRAARVLKKNPGLKPARDRLFQDAYADGLKEAALETGLPASIFSIEAPFTLSQALDETFWGAARPASPDMSDGPARA